jgi:hypothetical protein
MLPVTSLAMHGAPPALVEVWAKHVRDLTEVQDRAIRAGALDGSTNLLVVAPTSSGKTFVGEMATTTSAFVRRRHAIFIVPFKALAEEHFLLFRERYRELLSVVISTSDWSEYDDDIRAGNFNLAVMTYEKLMSFLVHQPSLVARCTALIVDEVQSLSDGDRGARLEMLLRGHSGMGVGSLRPGRDRRGGALSGRDDCAWRGEAGSDLDLEPQVHLAGHLAPADAPVLRGRLVQHHEDIGGGDSQLAEVADQCLVQAALGLAGATGEHRDLDQDEVVAAAGRQLEVFAGVLDDALHPVVVRDPQSLHKGGVRGVHERLLLGC